MLKINKKASVVMPEKYISGFVTDFYVYLLKMLQEIFEIDVSTQKNFNPKSDIIFVFSLSHWEENHHMILELDNSKKIIIFQDDLFFRSELEIELTEQIFNRANLILHSSKTSYELMWKEHLHKSIWFPLFAAPYFYKNYNPCPIKRCLLTGQTKKTHYPLRDFVIRSKNQFVDVMPHPGYANPIGCVGENYAEKINSYFCCVTDSGKTYGSLKYTIFGSHRPINLKSFILRKNIDFEKLSVCGQVLLKIFEISACGSLLLTDEFAPEIELLEFKNGVNYLKVHEGNVNKTIEDCCSNSEKYEEIRFNGWKLAKKHTINIRKKELEFILSFYLNKQNVKVL